MRLHTRQWGEGDRVAVLVHGLMGDCRAFRHVGAALAERGWRAVAVDLPGHGRSPRDAHATFDDVIDALVDAVPGQPALALGHSLGAVVVGAALERLRPQRAIYVDVPFTPVSPLHTRAERESLAADLAEGRAMRDTAALRRAHSTWDDEDCRVEERAARLFDVPTAVSVRASSARTQATVPSATAPSLMVHASPSRYVSDERLAELRALGFETRGIPGAGHTVWYGHVTEFMTVLDAWL